MAAKTCNEMLQSNFGGCVYHVLGYSSKGLPFETLNSSNKAEYYPLNRRLNLTGAIAPRKTHLMQLII